MSRLGQHAGQRPPGDGEVQLPGTGRTTGQPSQCPGTRASQPARNLSWYRNLWPGRNRPRAACLVTPAGTGGTLWVIYKAHVVMILAVAWTAGLAAAIGAARIARISGLVDVSGLATIAWPIGIAWVR